ncbi:MAG: peptidoglycan-binding protein [Brevibacterium aurantiacum]|uniref:N-acetylmuramoyl-L-alanine amidase n=1 Tax=Brevibacterium aurantiacum TaxID=273384 RepID=A0A1D7W916_BREAU|nr:MULTISPECIES: peptidoglycan-binding protein [Brevibacterium]MDN5593420.1 peptidoglycan-binding protein [Brevibacterium sp.]AOP55537.1 N-acetylmuramoyl-L-alanine amidase [Brevibacterium aurantiacum]MDN5711764.1 peptidoglycan-binding protein [Brevibacterium aurantiacum]PCC18188.1 N-acetylmuramoyl-L-alanine amidase [Brevibacterium aurantiacum]PCC44177.1 N-acetylmuramoyl-L-alanine amidase [Brevibacterium aurantiacum]
MALTHNPHPQFSRGTSSEVLPNIKSQMARLGLNVGDTDSDEFDRAFELGVRQFQQVRGILCDGVMGKETFTELERARYQLGDRVLRYDPVRVLTGDDVLRLQRTLAGLGFYAGRMDAEYSAVTDAAVKELQMSLGTKVDGIAGPQTLRGLDAIDRKQDTGNLFALEERARVAASGTSLAGRTFVIEAATTVVDFVTLPMTSEQAETERRITTDIATRLAGRLEAVGAGAIVLDGDAVEVNTADQLGASAVVTVTADVNKSKDANGIATFFFGHETHSDINSPTGARLAELIQSELTARTGMKDCRTHARTWSSLTRLRTPKVHVVSGYLTNMQDLENLEDPNVRDAIADGIAAGLQRLYVREDSDPETGTLSLAEIKAYS